MWRPSIIGFGKYHYKYSSGHEGDAPIVGFSPRRAKISLYLTLGNEQREKLLKDFGKYTTGTSCIYMNKVADIEIEILKSLIEQSALFIKELYPNQE